MTERQSSRTAWGVAMLRAVHQILDGDPPILRDPIIGRIVLGRDAEKTARENEEQFQSGLARGLRSHVVLRSRVSEDRLADAVARGVRQFVVLGAGLDTFPYRQPAWASDLSIVEVDHPASQQLKREMLHEVGVDVPSNVRFADIDFEHETLADGLVRCGVSSNVPTFFSWLGVTMYLTRDAIDAVLETVAKFPPESEIVLTFAQPRGEGEEHNLAERAAELGEPWLSYFTPDEIDGILRAHGFRETWFLSREEATRQYYADRQDGLLPPRSISIVSAIV
jgi:methyltransferase (TIGR00027 family)